jgi:hypothetical protein
VTVKYNPIIGHISDIIGRAIKMAEIAKEPVELTFNDTVVTVAISHSDQVYMQWYATRETDQARAALEPKP